jgi:hypothetical protein
VLSSSLEAEPDPNEQEERTGMGMDTVISPDIDLIDFSKRRYDEYGYGMGMGPESPVPVSKSVSRGKQSKVIMDADSGALQNYFALLASLFCSEVLLIRLTLVFYTQTPSRQNLHSKSQNGPLPPHEYTHICPRRLIQLITTIPIVPTRIIILILILIHLVTLLTVTTTMPDLFPLRNSGSSTPQHPQYKAHKRSSSLHKLCIISLIS